jgi:hypothetical protein
MFSLFSAIFLGIAGAQVVQAIPVASYSSTTTVRVADGEQAAVVAKLAQFAVDAQSQLGPEFSASWQADAKPVLRLGLGWNVFTCI